MGQFKKTARETTTKSSPTVTIKRKDVWTTLLQISVWHALAEGRLHHRPYRAHLLDSHHSWLQHQVPLRLRRQRLDKLGGLGVHLLPGLLHRRHLGGRRLHKGVC